MDKMTDLGYIITRLIKEVKYEKFTYSLSVEYGFSGL